MTAQAIPAARQRAEYLKFCGLALAIVVVLVAVGWKPTESLAGREGVRGMLMGSALSLLASLLGALPVGFGDLSGSMATTWNLAATGIRLGVALLGAVAVLVAGWFEAAPLLLWVALSHGALLAVDTRFALRAARRSTTKLEEE
jgi:hypothetical protein